MKITKRQLKRIIKEEKQKLLEGDPYGDPPRPGKQGSADFDMSDPRLVNFQKALDTAFFNAIQSGADIGDIGLVAEKFLATMGYKG